MIPRAFVSAFLLPTATACVARHSSGFLPVQLRFADESRGMPYWLAGWLADRLCTALHSAHAKAVQTPNPSQHLSGSIDPLLPPTHLRTLSAVPQATTVAYCAVHLIHKATSHTRQSPVPSPQSPVPSLPVFQSPDLFFPARRPSSRLRAGVVQASSSFELPHSLPRLTLSGQWCGSAVA